MEKNRRLNRKNERGAITLFVLIACLFFALVLTGVYVATLNKMQTQEQQVDQIQENYARQLENIDEIYNELSGNVKLQLTQEPEGGTWTKEVTLIGNAEVKEGETVRIKEFAFGKENESISSLEWKEATNGQKITETTKVTENGIYYFWVEDSDGEIYQSNPVEVTNIDKTAPTPGSIIAKEENAEGEEYDLEKSPWTDKNVYIEKIDGTDGESGHAETTYTVKKDGITIHENIQEPIILEESGIYEITVTTKDNSENKATSEPYTIKIDKEVPILALKHIDKNGDGYDGTWTKDNLYGEITLDTTYSGKSVEKYQYSNNGVIWEDVSNKITQSSIDYKTTFPMSGDKPDWFSGPTNNGTYYFETQADGTLKPNNSGKNNTTANSYFEIDLTNQPNANVEITINATISSQILLDYGYATITTSPEAPPYNQEEGRFIYEEGNTSTSDYTTTLTGGQKYYLHIGYRKDILIAMYQDTFIINSIRIKADNLTQKINFYNYSKNENTVSFNFEEKMENEIYIRAVYTDGTISKYADKTSIKIDKVKPTIENTNTILVSREVANVEVKATDKDSGLKGYYISASQTIPTENSNWNLQSLSEFTIENLKTGTTYYLWIIDNAGNVSETYNIVIGKKNYIVDDKLTTETLAEAITIANDESIIKLLGDYMDASDVTFNKSVTFDVQGYTLTRDKTITISSGKTVEITGTGKITSETNNVMTITNNGILTIGNSITIESTSTSINYAAPIYTNNSSSITNINDNVQIKGYHRGIYNYNGTVNINGGKIEATYQNNSAYGIYNYASNSKTYINAGEVRGYFGIDNGSSATLEIRGGKVIGTGAYGISASGTTYIYGGRIEGKTYGIYSSSSDKVTIGREEDELSTTIPAIYGGNYGIYMSYQTYNFNFFNGVLISNTKETAYRGQANLRTAHITYTYIDYEIEQRYCTILTPSVTNIEIEANPTEYTNQNVTVRIFYPNTTDIKQYSENGIDWQDTSYNNEELIVEENKTIYARIINELGTIIEEKQLSITNIDKEKPTVDVTPTQTKYTVAETNETVDLNITIKAQDTGVSGLDKVQYAWAEEGETPNYKNFTNEVTISKTQLEIGTYYLYINVTDKAGNKADIEQIRYTVEYQEPVAQIGDTKYLTIQEAIEACSKTAGETQTTIEILKNTDEEFTTYEGQNIKIDLKGYTIGSSNSDTPICTNNGTLQIVDTSTEKTGKLESLNGIAIENKGTLTIGDNNTGIEMEVPTIYGKQVGIKNENILNFYDGKIQGMVPIQGNVTHAPEQFGPVSTGYENGITTIQLGIVSGYEARIEWIYYTTIQDAIKATKNNVNKETRDTVTIIKDIQLKDTLEINPIKNIILDLDGYTLTVVPEKNTVIYNYGEIEITDSSQEQKGAITIESTNECYGIYNSSNGTIQVTRGTVSSNQYGIYNNSTDSVIVDGGTVSSSNNRYNSIYGIYNNGTGSVIVKSGTVNSSNLGKSYGIYNSSSGTVQVKGGTVNSSSNSKNDNEKYYSYGIYNARNGSIIIEEGTVNSNSNNYATKKDSYAIYNSSNGTVQVKGGTVNGSSDVWEAYGIYNSTSGTIIIEGGMVIGLDYGIYNSGGIVTITGGTVNSEQHGIYNNSTGIITVTGGTVSSSYGIYNNSTGSVIIGDKEKELSNEKPKIQGKYIGTSSSKGCGIYNTIRKC